MKINLRLAFSLIISIKLIIFLNINSFSVIKNRNGNNNSYEIEIDKKRIDFLLNKLYLKERNYKDILAWLNIASLNENNYFKIENNQLFSSNEFLSHLKSLPLNNVSNHYFTRLKINL